MDGREINDKVMWSSPREFYTGGMVRATRPTEQENVKEGRYLLRARVYLPCAVPAKPLLGEIALCCLKTKTITNATSTKTSCD
jgi:hypothetical protein